MKNGAIALLALCLASSATAQTRGTVKDDAGQPVEGAIVELLSAGARLAVTTSDSSGSFAFLPSFSGVALVVRRIGFSPARIVLASAPRPLVVVLRRRAVQVAGVTVRARGAERCVEHDQRDARSLWDVAAAKYAPATLMPRLMGRGKEGAADIPPDSLGVFDSASARPVTVAGSGRRPMPYNKDRFYAQPPLIGMSRSFQWDYPWLESVQAWHFADRLFGELNKLAFAPAAAGPGILDFCSDDDGNRPYIIGRLFVGPDTTLLKAEWRFVTEGPSEDAGGEVVFMPPAPGAPLLAASGHFWRAKASGYWQEWTEFEQWYRCENETGRCANPVPLGR